MSKEALVMEISDLKKIRGAIVRQLDAVNAQLRAKETELVTLTSTIKIGQRLTFNDQEFEVVSLAPSGWGTTNYYGRRILKNGGLHKTARQIWPK